jgi:hypothetical protein
MINPTGKHNRGVALIITLTILSIVTLMLIAFTISMRVENSAARNYNDTIRARQIAQAALDTAVANLRDAMPQPSPGFTYVTFPGSTRTYNGSTMTTNVLFTTSMYPWIFNIPGSLTINLNAGGIITGLNSSYPTTNNTPLLVQWVTVGSDGSIPATEKIVGRFAYYIDDDAARLNLNAFWKRPNSSVTADTYGYGDTSEIDVTVLDAPFNSGAVADAIYTNRLTYPYTTVPEVRTATALITADSFDANKFHFTRQSVDSYNLDAFGRARINLHTMSQSNDIDTIASPSGAYYRMAEPALGTSYGLGGISFATKYGAAGLQQIIANIIAYQSNPTNSPPPDGGGEPPVYLGLGKTPYINEVQISYADSTGTVTRTVSVELFHMYDNVYQAADTLEVKQLPAAGGFATVEVLPVTNNISPGYLTFSTSTNLTGAILPITVPSQNIIATYRRGASRLDFAELTLPSVTITTNATVLHGAQVLDPRVNHSPSQWLGYTTGGTLGAANNRTDYGGSGTYPGTNDVSKALSRGAPMRSIGELGYIHAGQPFRHIRLQPTTVATEIPDWAVLDLFQVPDVTNIGRLNINSLITSPATNPASARFSAVRSKPLEALLNNVVASPSAVAVNIYSNQLIRHFGMTNAYDTIGEICQVAALTNGAANEAARELPIRRIGNLITTRSNAFTIHIIAQSVLELPLTGQIYGTFQTGTPVLDIITGEVRIQAVVERTQEGGQVQYRTKYFRYLYD